MSPTPLRRLGALDERPELPGEIGAARRVVEKRHAPHDDVRLLGEQEPVRVAVVVVLQEAGCSDDHAAGSVLVDPVGADERDDLTVVADDHGRVRVVALRRGVSRVLLVELRPRAAEDLVGTRRPLARERRAEEVGAATDDVVLATVAEDDVVAAAAFDVVAAVARARDGRIDQERIRRVDAGADAVADRRRARMPACGAVRRGGVGGDRLNRSDRHVPMSDIVD